jgi:hypothetical protein
MHFTYKIPSNILFISNGKKSGARTIAKSVALLKNLTYIELGTNITP